MQIKNKINQLSKQSVQGPINQSSKIYSNKNRKILKQKIKFACEHFSAVMLNENSPIKKRANDFIGVGENSLPMGHFP